MTLHQEKPINDAPKHYVNRLSDLIFAFARVLSRRAGGSEVLWQQLKALMIRLPGTISLLVRQRSAAIHQQVLAGDVRRAVRKIPDVLGNGGRRHNLTGGGAITKVLTHGAVHFFA